MVIIIAVQSASDSRLIRLCDQYPPETVSVNINHHGTRTLTQGSQWAQEATQIAPYETKRVLRFNRYTGVKSGQTYNFDTVITGGGSSVTLKQSMTGT